MSPGRRPSTGSLPERVSSRPSANSTPPISIRKRPGAAALTTPMLAERETGRQASDELEAGEEVADLEARGVGAVGAVDHVGLDGAGQVLADRARRGLGRVGGPHDLAQARDRVLALEHQRDAGARAHEVAQAREERPLPVHVVEAFGLRPAEAAQPQRQDREAGFLEARQHLARLPGLHRVRLDDRESSFLQDLLPLALPAGAFNSRATAAPMSAGDFTTWMPAAFMALIFSAAVPLPPA